MNYMKDYWIESVESSLEEAGVTATKEQIENIASDMEISSEQQSMANGHDVATKNYHSTKDDEIANLEKMVVSEREKVICKECNGRGRIITQGPYHSSDSQCSKCRGYGRHDP